MTSIRKQKGRDHDAQYKQRMTSLLKMTAAKETDCTLYLVAIICPATKFHVAMLIVEGEPSDVYLACALENARGHVQATAVVSDHHVGLVCPVKTLVSTCNKKIPSFLCLFTSISLHVVGRNTIFFKNKCQMELEIRILNRQNFNG